ncbi:exopolyphosphatase prune [Arctopsyche grandis]|uniref:exopolyphosphatase prune n=1 Tax=Arctopsyche grandis TaxID=121162 RepID=UPI00406D7AA4
MDTYLKNSRHILNDQKELKNLVIVMGNESCDLDSAVSSLVYAFFLHWTYANSSEVNRHFSDTIFVPILNVDKEDLPIKTEVMYFLNKNSISIDNIICRDQVDVELLLSKYHGQLILVDHHILSTRDANLFAYVKNIFDHRPKDVIAWKYDVDIVESNIVEVGSCASVICSEIVKNKANIEFLNQNRDSTYLLYGTIVLDTVNFLVSADKARPLDFEMAELLEKILSIENCDRHKKQLFEDLLRARTDYSNLNVHHLLKRDLKIMNKISIPGLPMLVEEYLQMKDSMNALETFSTDNNCSAIVLMGLKVQDDVVNRDMAVCGTKETIKAIVDGFCKSTSPNLGLAEKKSHSGKCRYFWQSNTKASRKQIIPLLKALDL